ncbi:alpha/beta fold hydrolase [Ramlibacter rhizophilus]|uniref:Alpha/beta fold hydrolase n=1 Tax=Ramlibacter rhizophilus TaxID=1781167 RepID=A0A4Z0BIK0_9BURK|nr:alpha/beta fold hydrolase [Ramlibacter rhizophilus]TFY97964.1 alpha/beta fold hydrolase [Ramlibacter rhizophilus]
MKPVLLLVPGMLNDPGVWDEVAAAMPETVEVRRMATLTQDSVPAMAQAAWAQVADVSPAVPLLVAGFSLGGYVVLEMLANAPRAVAGVALVSTSARPESAEGAANREKTMAAMRGDFAKVVEGIVKWGMHAPSPELAQRLRRMMLDVGAAIGIAQTRATMARGDHRALLPRLRMPASVLCGAQDRITPPALSEELAALLPSGRLSRIDLAGHMLPLEQPGAVAAALVELLARASAPGPTIDNDEGDK